MSRKQIVLASALAVVALLVLALALGTRRAPYLPEDGDHSPDSVAACMGCHGLEGPLPRSTNHPLGDDCFRCHARR